MAKRPLKWAYGVTTVPERVDDTLRRTFASLDEGGFPEPYVWCDGGLSQDQVDRFVARVRPKLVTHTRLPRCNFGNWMLGAWELYLREPNADRYAMFEDDIVCVKNLRAYLDRCPYPDGKMGRAAPGYLNLFTYPHNVANNPGRMGWFPSDQYGKGALALVFDNATFRKVLHSKRMVEAVQAVNRGQRALDGAIARAMSTEHVLEYVHNPSLVQHTGHGQSVLRPHQNEMPEEKWLPQADTFPGEDFDATELPKLWRQRRENASSSATA